MQSKYLSDRCCFHGTPTPEFYTLSLHDALPICASSGEAERSFEFEFELPSFLTLGAADRKSTRLNSSHVAISYAVFCLKKKNGVFSFVRGAPHLDVSRRMVTFTLPAETTPRPAG